MLRKVLGPLFLIASFAIPATVHAQGDYVDIYQVKVKPEKTAEFEALTKKWVEANRANNGDRWLTGETVYGEGGVYQFISGRRNYADIDKANDAVMAAATKAFGADLDKMMQDFTSCLISSHSELRHRRWELSRKAPADAAAFTKLIASSKYLRVTAVRVRYGHSAEFETLLKDIKAAAEKNPDTYPALVSQAVEGTVGTTYYIATPRSSLAGFDNNPSMKDVLGEEGFKKYLHTIGETVESTESVVFHFNPELSNPPDELVAAAPDFWRPKH